VVVIVHRLSERHSIYMAEVSFVRSAENPYDRVVRVLVLVLKLEERDVVSAVDSGEGLGVP
jgi:hypothetical protein